MNDSIPDDPQPSPGVSTASRGRPELLNEAKRQTVVSLLANGCSRRVAASFVGCSPSTITRTANRDPAFAEEIARAQHMTQVRVLRALNNTACQDRYWRAGAWLLERLNPADFALRPPDTHTAEEVIQIVGTMAELVARDLPQEYRVLVADKLEGVLQEYATGMQPIRVPARQAPAESVARNHQAGPPSTRKDGQDLASAGGIAGDFCNAPLAGDVELTSSADATSAGPGMSCG